MATFEQAIPVILAHETLPGSTDGSYTNHPGDRGGPTKWGLSLLFFTSPDAFEWRDLSEHHGVALSFPAPADATGIRALTREQAMEVYRACWWDFFGYGRIGDERCATKIFDMAVNLRRPKAHALAQQAVVDLRVADLVIDGVLGPKTVAGINACEPKAYLNALCHEHLAFYQRKIDVDPSQAKFKKGWFARAAWPFHEAGLTR